MNHFLSSLTHHTLHLGISSFSVLPRSIGIRYHRLPWLPLSDFLPLLRPEPAFMILIELLGGGIHFVQSFNDSTKNLSVM
jgi:hypothetical protein